MPSAVLVYNEASGTHLAGDANLDTTVKDLEDAGVSVDVLQGDLAAQLRASVESRADIVVVDGGDGTIRAVIEAHRGRGRPIGIIPGGTMNLLAADYGVPTDRREAARIVGAGHTRAVDVGTVGDRLFLHAAFTGLPVRLGVHREHLRGKLKLWDKARLALHALATLPRDPTLTLDAETVEGESVSLTATSFAFIVGRIEDRILPSPHRTEVTGGLLTVFALHPESGADVARMLLRGALGSLAEDPSVDRILIRRGTLATPRRRMRAMLDGEATLLARRSAVEVLRGEVEVFVPADVTQGDPA
jgi:diacylglycerol kinase family enzyme